MLQLGSLIDTLNKAEAERRISYVVDTAVGSNADSKTLKGHLKKIREAVELPDPHALGQAEFLKRVGSGI